MNIIYGIFIPLIGTVLGASMVYFLKDKINNTLEKFLLGFASGVMIAASVWSLIMPSIDMAESQNVISWLPASIGFMLGIFFMLLLDNVTPHHHKNDDEDEGPKSKLSKAKKLFLAVTLHNIPEGMAVGVVFAGVLAGDNIVTAAGALALGIGMAIQNFPEGAIISAPLKSAGMSKNQAFKYGFLSGVVEPVAAIITILLAAIVTPILPYLLAFSAGSMIYVVVEELIPDSHEGKHSNLMVIGLSIGFVLMMILDVALGS